MAKRMDSAGSPKLAIRFPLGKPRIVEGVRQDLVSEVRPQIADGTYETDEKINGAIDALLANEGQELAGRR